MRSLLSEGAAALEGAVLERSRDTEPRCGISVRWDFCKLLFRALFAGSILRSGRLERSAIEGALEEDRLESVCGELLEEDSIRVFKEEVLGRGVTRDLEESIEGDFFVSDSFLCNFEAELIREFFPNSALELDGFGSDDIEPDGRELERPEIGEAMEEVLPGVTVRLEGADGAGLVCQAVRFVAADGLLLLTVVRVLESLFELDGLELEELPILEEIEEVLPGDTVRLEGTDGAGLVWEAERVIVVEGVRLVTDGVVRLPEDTRTS